MTTQQANKERRIFIDTNVFVGCFHKQKHETAALNYLLKLRDYECYTSSLSIAQTISTCQGKKTSKISKDLIINFIKPILARVKVIGFADKDIPAAFELPTNDIEDNIQYIIGSKLNCYYYITNNVKDYKFNNINPILPQNVKTISTC